MSAAGFSLNLSFSKPVYPGDLGLYPVRQVEAGEGRRTKDNRIQKSVQDSLSQKVKQIF